MRSPTVLVVADQRLARDSLARVQSEAGYAVRSSADGLAALDEVDRRPPDLVLSEVDLPVLDGFGLLVRLRRRGFDFPIVLMGGVRPRLPRPDMVFVAKPVDTEALLALVADLLVRGGSPRPRSARRYRERRRSAVAGAASAPTSAGPASSTRKR